MYDAFYQFRAEPFRLSPDHRFCFQHRTYRKAMTYMRHALHRAEGFIMITGRPGTGKTTLIHDLLRSLKPDQALVANLVTTQMTADDLIRLVAYSYNLDPEGADKVDVLIRLVHFLKKQHQQGRRPLLIVDEAQGMAEGALEELRLLTNIQSGGQQLLQIFLVGQEQLRDVVNAPSMEQLHQRMIAATHLDPLDCEDTEAYIKHRLRRVAWTGDPLISKEAYSMIQQHSQGIPRQINQICSRLFLHGSIEEKHRLGLADLRVVIDELREELLLPEETAENDAAFAWPADLHQETYEEEPREPAPVAIPENVSPATPTTPPAPETSQEPAPVQQGSTNGAPAGLHSQVERQHTAATSPATSNPLDNEGQTEIKPEQAVTGTEPPDSSHQESKQPVAGPDREPQAAVIGPETNSARETSQEAASPVREPAPITTQEARDTQVPRQEPASVTAPEARTAQAPHQHSASTATGPATDTSSQQDAVRVQQRPAANRTAARQQDAQHIAAAKKTDRVPDQPAPGKVRKRSSWVLPLVTGLLTCLSLFVMFNKNPELPRLAKQSLMAWFHTDTQKGTSEETEGPSPDITEPTEKTAKETVPHEPPAVNPKPKTEPEPAEIETAAQKSELALPQTSTVQLEEKLQQSGLLVERMDDDVLKVNLSSDGVFDFDSAQIKDGALPALEKLADVLRKQDGLTIQVVGHTDSSGAAEYNRYLSQRRAKAVADYLISQGLSDASIQSEGRGDRDTQRDQATSNNLKRRVEIYIRLARTS